jgi:hypothetical protein
MRHGPSSMYRERHVNDAILTFSEHEPDCATLRIEGQELTTWLVRAHPRDPLSPVHSVWFAVTTQRASNAGPVAVVFQG